MSKCKVCGARLEKGAVVCPVCGADVGSTAVPQHIKGNATLPVGKCPSCGQDVIGEHRFCPSCGVELAKVSADVTQEQKQFDKDAQEPVLHEQPAEEWQEQASEKEPVQSKLNRRWRLASESNGNGIDEESLLEDAYIRGLSSRRQTSEWAYLHYKQAFRTFASGGIPVNWNWAFALLAPVALPNRRNTLWGLLAMFGTFIGFIGVMVVFIAMGLFGDRISYGRYKRIVARARRSYPDDLQEQLSFVGEKGGRKLSEAVIAAAVMAAILLLKR